MPATDAVYSWLGLKGLNFIAVMAPPAPIYKEGDEQKKNPLSDGEREKCVL